MFRRQQALGLELTGASGLDRASVPLASALPGTWAPADLPQQVVPVTPNTESCVTFNAFLRTTGLRVRLHGSRANCRQFNKPVR